MIKAASKNTDNTRIPSPPPTPKNLSKQKWDGKQVYEYFKRQNLIIYLFQFKMWVVQFKMGIVQFKMEKLL